MPDTSLTTIFRLLGIGCLIALAVLSLVPGHLRPHVLGSGGLEHFTAYLGTAMFVCVGFRRIPTVLWIAALSALAGVFELLQNFVPGRSPGVDNWLASSAGALVGAVLVVAVARLWPARRTVQEF